MKLLKNYNSQINSFELLFIAVQNPSAHTYKAHKFKAK